jgi:tRNA A-37 threonylcarbamoyl transferase component Bud32
MDASASDCGSVDDITAIPGMKAGSLRPIAYGRTAEILPWRDGQVLKLFYDWCDASSIEYEARIARAIHASGLSVPAVGGLVSVGGRRGLVYQRIDGGSMLEMLWRRPWRAFGYARIMAELQAEIHGKPVPEDFPSQRQRLAWNISRAGDLPGSIRSGALAALEAMPDGDRLCHGDFHPGNIMMTAGGGKVIDWIDATSGRPMADLARTTVIATGAVAGQLDDVLQKLVVRILHSSYIRWYFRLRPGGEDEYRRWLPIVAAARMAENIPELEDWLAGFASARL